MSHPKNKLERFEVGKTKGTRRGAGYWNGFISEAQKRNHEEAQRFLERNAQLRRNTTKLCSCNLCGNPRKWYKDKSLQEKKFEQKYLDYIS
jgi:hypothetical protein